jgi:hypothetical protein
MGCSAKGVEQWQQESEKVRREPYAYWKGNPDVVAKRQELVKCNVSSTQEWNARIYKQVLGLSLCYIVVCCTNCNGLLSSHRKPSIISSIYI